ncbi:hypothetical protein BH20ACT7_BH20ACT7_14360 [soil metagenome]
MVKSRVRFLVLVMCTLALSASQLVAASAADTATPASAGGEISSTTVEAAAANSAASYWTRERMANAKPVKLRAPAGGSNTAAAAAATKGPRVSVAPAAGALGGDGPVAQAAAALARPYTNLPDRLNVKIFFSQASGGNFVCSGTIANSTTKRMVSTAGHCVSNGAGQFHRNVVVVPGYSSRCDGCGDAPYGRWTARELTTTTEWHSFSNFKQDVAYIIVNDRNGQRIVNRLGGQGSRFNVSRSQQFRSYGYPQAAPFNGFNQYVCPSGRLADDNPSSRPGPLTIRISCNMTGGSSGGGWLIAESGGLGFINSVNSYKYVSGPKANANHMYGPYFGNEALNLFNFTVGRG